MTGAELILRTLAASGVEVCFANPGTTEIPFVAELDAVPEIRPVLGLFEGVCTGAADGYGRMREEPAMALLHLGPGLGYGLPNLHNARRAGTPLVTLVGEHASWHRASDPPLGMDIHALAGTVSGWHRTCHSPDSLSQDSADAVAAAMRGQVACLVVPHDYQWAECARDAVHVSSQPAIEVDRAVIRGAADTLRSAAKALILLGGNALREQGLRAADRIKSATGCDLMCETLPAYMDRGAGLPSVDRLPYFPAQAMEALSKYDTILLAGTSEPVAFFGYKDGPSKLLTQDHTVYQLAQENVHPAELLAYLADETDGAQQVDRSSNAQGAGSRPEPPSGTLTAESAVVTLAALQPEGAIIVDESVTSGASYYVLAATAPRHSLLTLTGGSLGQGMPCAVGAAMACPDRPVINLQADGSAMYTVQSLWTQAREALDVTTLICANKSYQILRIEMVRAGHVPPGDCATNLTDLGRPETDWVKIAESMGVPGVRVDTCEDLAEQLTRALREPGPHLIEMNL